ncbi:MAG: tRNA pseudouridine(55) synthase TruB [Coriobacteriales bacterium]|jgi:tRNA pseudouridine55 synthase|nr:tRNA pseudouridine(55) synthase TruB [Coriobacteriales bacterium]
MPKARRGSTGLSGILALDKPRGNTSHDVISAVRSISGEGRVGHAGTLDPLATGVLLVCLGPATRLADYLMGHDKSYEARIVFGTATNTDDAEGELVRRLPLPARLDDAAFASSFLEGLLGEQQQVPPQFSALKKDGKTAYNVARAGGRVELAPRLVRVETAQLLAIGEGYWDVRFVVSKGTYIRSLARDIGEALGSCAHLGALRRTAAGAVSIEQTITLEDVKGATALDGLFIDPVQALGFPVLELDEQRAGFVEQGRSLDRGMGLAQGYEALLPLSREETRIARQTGADSLVALVRDGLLLALYHPDVMRQRLVPRVVIPGGVKGVR